MLIGSSQHFDEGSSRKIIRQGESFHLTANDLVNSYRQQTWTLKFNAFIYSIWNRLWSSQGKNDRDGNVPYWSSISIGVLYFAIFAVLMFIFQGQAASKETEVTLVALATVTALNFTQSERLSRNTFRIMFEELRLPETENWHRFPPKFQPQAGLLLTLIQVPFIEWAIDEVYTNRVSSGLVLDIAVSIVCFFISTSVYSSLFFSYNFSKEILQSELPLHKFHPHESPPIKSLLHFSDISFIAQGTASSVIILGIIISRPNTATFTFASIASLVALILLLFSFITFRMQIGKVVGVSIGKMLDEINSEIEKAYYSGEGVETKDKSVQYLFFLHDRIKKESQWKPISFSGLPDIIRTFFIPVLTLLISNLEIIKKIISNIY